MRLRNALRELRDGQADGRRVTRSYDLEVALASEGAILQDADLVRVLRAVDGLRARVDAVEQRGWGHRGGRR